jgi:hypothetical protein
MKTILIFEFGNDEDAAQKARHRVEGWKQGFRLGDKLALRFERVEAADDVADEPGGGTAEAGEGKVEQDDHGGHAAKRKKTAAARTGVRVAILLDFSAHEKLSYHRWLERIPAEKPFTGVPHETVSHGEDKFATTAEWFDSLKINAPPLRARK